MSETNQFVTKTALGAWEYQDETFEVKHTDVDDKVNLSTKFCKTQLTPLLQGDEREQPRQRRVGRDHPGAAALPPLPAGELHCTDSMKRFFICLALGSMQIVYILMGPGWLST